MPRLKTRYYEITDLKALFQAYPQFFKVVPDHGKIGKAIALELNLPGVAINSMEDENEKT